MYGLIVPAGVSREVAEALEGDHHNPAIEEMQARMDLVAMAKPSRWTMAEAYIGVKGRWGEMGDKHGRQ